MAPEKIKNKINLAVLISGRGSNLQALIDACRNPDFPARISVVISNKADAGGLAKAQNAHIPVEVVSHAKKGRAAFDDELTKALENHDVDLICLAGFMRILGGAFVDRWQNRILNIHPSLLPDYKGTDTHARVLADGKRESGCTVHFVTADLDDGPAVVQKRVPVIKNDTPQSLAQRILEQEHVAYPEAVKMLARKKLSGGSFFETKPFQKNGKLSYKTDTNERTEIMGRNAPVEADQDAVSRAEKTWHDFIKIGKWSIIHVIFIMGLLLLVYLK